MGSQFKGRVIVDPQGYRWDDEFAAGLNTFPRDDDECLRNRLVGRSDQQLLSAMLRTPDESPPEEWPSYDPFVKEPALFRIFASLDATPAAYLRFADQWGSLSTLRNARRHEQSRFVQWYATSASMANQIKLAERYLAAQKSGRNRKRPVSEALKLVNDILADATRISIKAEQRGGVVVSVMVVDELLNAMRLQLADMILELREFRSCEHCGKPFPVDAARSDRAFCSDNCRVKAYYRRRKKAIALRESGTTLREIVKETGSDMATIKKWVGSKGK
ncbi:MAG: hypothetical protein DWQ37_10260 [Planctomycetota bacterium]|nr:MAG: hypothetical protein DWQ37_10260 [Planctomycetota bacterium]